MSLGARTVVDAPCPEGADDSTRGVHDERGGHRNIAARGPEQEAVVPRGTAPVASADCVEDHDGEAADDRDPITDMLLQAGCLLGRIDRCGEGAEPRGCRLLVILEELVELDPGRGTPPAAVESEQRRACATTSRSVIGVPSDRSAANVGRRAPVLRFRRSDPNRVSSRRVIANQARPSPMAIHAGSADSPAASPTTASAIPARITAWKSHVR